ncbi:hypothetical protein ERO13_D05G166250v2 [Gossypium hirsutum]|nr:hypothetical protein ERO13_D05G166250v2 [Gossypium hirsutum]
MGFCIVMKLWQYSRLLHQNQSFFDYLNWRLVREACALSLHEVTWLGVKNLKEDCNRRSNIQRLAINVSFHHLELITKHENVEQAQKEISNCNSLIFSSIRTVI